MINSINKLSNIPACYTSEKILGYKLLAYFKNNSIASFLASS